MRTRDVIATIAVTGAVATFALLNVGSVESTNFLSTPLSVAEREFINFIAEHQRSYGTKEEYQYRLEKFADNFNYIQDFNANNEETELGINMFADLTEYEFSQRLGKKSSPFESEDDSEVEIHEGLDFSSTPSSWDWTKKGAVSHVKDQGGCGSCWAFAGVATLEGLYYLKHGSMKTFSEQQMVDCVSRCSCDGGWAQSAIDHAVNHKTNSDSDYKYKGKDGSCKENNYKGYFSVKKHVNVKSKSDSALIDAIHQQPTAVSVQANQRVFQFYKGGVVQEKDCGTRTDHAVTAVGYDSDSIKIKNSWGSGWGEKGYIRLARNKKGGSGTCGVYTDSCYPVA